MSRDNWFTTSEPDRVARQLLEGGDTMWCDTCRLIHAKELACAVVLARVHALIIEPGDELCETDIEGEDRLELLSALRLRGISLEAIDTGWRATATVSA